MRPAYKTIDHIQRTPERFVREPNSSLEGILPLEAICEQLDLGMRTRNLAFVRDSVQLLGAQANIPGFVFSPALLSSFRVIFYLLTVVSNVESAFDVSLRAQALWALTLLIRDVDSGFGEVALRHGVLLRLGAILEEHVPEFEELMPGLLGYLALHCQNCRDQVACGVPIAALQGFIESGNGKTREDGLKVIIWLCRGPISSPEKRAELAQCLLSVFGTPWRDLFWLALVGIAFWIEHQPPEIPCFDVFWGAQTPFAVTFSGLFAETDPDIVISLLMIIKAVLSRGEAVPGLPVPPILQWLNWPDLTGDGKDAHRNAVLRHVAEVLGLLSSRREYQSALIRHGMLEAFENAFAGATFDIKEEMGFCVACLVSYGTTAVRREVIEKKGIEMLMEVLVGGRDARSLDMLSALGDLMEAGQRCDGSNRFIEIIEKLDGRRELTALLDHPLEGVAALAEEMLGILGSGQQEARPPLYQF
jgi:hypothetical protein